MLEDNDYPKDVLEVEDELLLYTCEQHEYNYTIITKNDLVIPQNDTVETIRWKNFLYGKSIY